MSRYISFVIWVGMFWVMGNIIGNVPAPVLAYGTLTLIVGILITNWVFGKHNPTGLPYFNPPSEKEDKNK